MADIYFYIRHFEPDGIKNRANSRVKNVKNSVQQSEVSVLKFEILLDIFRIKLRRLFIIFLKHIIFFHEKKNNLI